MRYQGGANDGVRASRASRSASPRARSLRSREGAVARTRTSFTINRRRCPCQMRMRSPTHTHGEVFKKNHIRRRRARDSVHTHPTHHLSASCVRLSNYENAVFQDVNQDGLSHRLTAMIRFPTGGCPKPQDDAVVAVIQDRRGTYIHW